MNKHQKLTIQLLSNQIGDNTARARAAFRNCTTKQMQELYGQSEQTRAQILNGYEKRDAEIQAAIDWIKEQA